ncbi:MAG: CDP-diacylglycerol--glycerol-3-phosphate 3-phosphatidyltransferase [Clostridia bacterium]|nr:CDP-diacylglycerol--glycerol-3-phosphate 3-phosphatidyltransferase [Clostridia bacterium]
MNLPNKLTFLRIILIPFVMASIMIGQNNYIYMYVAFALFAIACITDFLDGYIARKYNLVTNLGKFMDPIADKLLIICTLICFVQIGCEVVYDNVWWVLALIVAREISITAFRTIAAEKGTVIAANMWGKVKTNAQMFWTILLILYFPLTSMMPYLLATIYIYVTNILMILTALLTIVSFTIYLIQNKNVLKENK